MDNTATLPLGGLDEKHVLSLQIGHTLPARLAHWPISNTGQEAAEPGKDSEEEVEIIYEEGEEEELTTDDEEAGQNHKEKMSSINAWTSSRLNRWHQSTTGSSSSGPAWCGSQRCSQTGQAPGVLLAYQSMAYLVRCQWPSLEMQTSPMQPKRPGAWSVITTSVHSIWSGARGPAWWCRHHRWSQRGQGPGY